MESSAFVEVASKIATIEEGIRQIRKDIDSLCHVVRDGNGQPSLVQRLTTVETKIQQQDRALTEIAEHANSILASRMLTRTQLVVGISGMLFTALISAAALVATLIK